MPEHLRAIELQDAQRMFSSELSSDEYVAALAASEYAYAFFSGDRLVCCAGCIEMWPGRAMLWALMSKDAGPSMTGLFRAGRGFIAGAKWRRIEALVDDGFSAGHRFVRMLGFELETPRPMQAYRQDGRGCFLYARVKNG